MAPYRACHAQPRKRVTMRRYVTALLVLMVMGSVALPMARPVRAASPLVVIVASTLPISDIDTGLLRRAFQGEAAEYASGKRLIPINHPQNTPARDQFDLAVLGLKPDAVGRFWVDRRIRDQPGPPKTVPSIELALRLVMSLPGAITYVTPDLVNPKVKTLSVDGKNPGQGGYLLQ